MSGMDAHHPTPQDRDEDEVLLADLARGLRDVTPLAERVAQQARGALAWRSLDADLLVATLHFDSALAGAGQTRGPDEGNRLLVFHAAPLSVELELQSDRLVGQLVPPGPGEVTLESADGTTIRADADELGFFLVPLARRGSVRVHCETSAARLVTDWFPL
jgi:hypothetical protein